MKTRAWIRDLRTAISVTPAVYVPLARITKGNFVVGRHTDIVIEGFPRSGNSYAEAAFRLSQRKEMKIAHHCHAAAQVIYASTHNIPCLVLIRDPIDACRSLHLMALDFLSMQRALREYYTFYEAIERYRENYVLAKFSTVTGDFSRIIQSLNGKFDRNYAEHLPPSEIIFAEVNRLSLSRGATDENGEPYSPSRDPQFLAQRARDKDVAGRLAESDHLRAERERAEAVFRRFADGADI